MRGESEDGNGSSGSGSQERAWDQIKQAETDEGGDRRAIGDGGLSM